VVLTNSSSSARAFSASRIFPISFLNSGLSGGVFSNSFLRSAIWSRKKARDPLTKACSFLFLSFDSVFLSVASVFSFVASVALFTTGISSPVTKLMVCFSVSTSKPFKPTFSSSLKKPLILSNSRLLGPIANSATRSNICTFSIRKSSVPPIASAFELLVRKLSYAFFAF